MKGARGGLVKNLLTRRVSKDATVAVSLSKPMRGDAHVVGIIKEKKTIFLILKRDYYIDVDPPPT
jgi:hypothetical protein